MSFFYNFKSLSNLIRFRNLFILAIVQYLTSYFLISPPLPYWSNVNIHLIVLITFLVAAAGNIINDYYDIKIDSINRPEQVVIGRSISRRKAIFLNASFNIIAILISLFISYRFTLLIVTCIFILWSYSNQFKRAPLVGNLLIAFLSALSILLIPFHYQQFNIYLFFYVGFCFLLSFIREVIKDIEDKKGDKKFDCNTLPIAIGTKKTKWIITLFILLLITLISFFLILDKDSYLLYVVIAGLTYLIIGLFEAKETGEYAHLSSYCKILMLVGLMNIFLV